MNGDTQILICTDVADMGVNIPDIKWVIQWMIYDHLTLATLVQRMGRARRDSKISAVTVLLVEQKQVVPEDMTGAATEFAFARLPVMQENKEEVKKAVQEMYEGNMQIRKEAGLSLFHTVDPPLLWYLNTTRCHRRLSLACFVNKYAFNPQVNSNICCDNCIYKQANEDNNERNQDMTLALIPKWRLYGITVVHLLNYRGTKGWAEKELEAMTSKEYELRLQKEQQRLRCQLNGARGRGMTAVAKSAAAATHYKELEDALDVFAINTWPGGLDTLMFPKVWRWKLAAKSGSIKTKEDMAKVLRPACELSISVLGEWATSLLNLVHTTV